MATYSYAQLERLWIQAGGPKNLAPLMAAIAKAESGGNSQAYNPSGASGLWQILGQPFPGDVWDPLTNARMAVAKYRSQGLGAWETYTNGAYKQFFKGTVPPSAHVSATSGGGSQAASSAFGGATSAVRNTGALLHGTATVLDRFFALFAPGQGWRIAFGAGALAAGAGSYGAFRTTATSEDAGRGQLPLAILLLGVACIAAFMALRPWPQASGKPVKPGAYVVDVLEGQPPPAGPPAFSASEVRLTEVGLGSLVALWAAGKAGSALSSAAQGASAVGGLLGKLFRAGETAAGDAAAEGG